MHIAIVGAGLCGLTVAATLAQQSTTVHFTLYESDTAPDSRSQGYAIGLKDESGLGVLARLGLRSPLLARGAARIRSFHIVDQQGRELLSAGANHGDRNRTYRVNRRDIKAVLQSALPAGSIRYGTRCIGYGPDAGGVRLRFADGSDTLADYVLGCDGAGSTLRAQMLGRDKHYVGLSSIYGDAQLEVGDEPLLDESFFITLGDNGASLLAYRQPGGVLFSYAFRTDEPTALDALPGDALLAMVRAGTERWHPLVQRITAGTVPASLGTRAFYDWAPETTVQDGRVLLLGDAAHPMTPFQGQAANIGMLDAYEVGCLLAQHAAPSEHLARALAKQERTIRRRGRKAVLQSRETGLDFHLSARREQVRRARILRAKNVAIKLSTTIKQLVPRRSTGDEEA